MRRIGCALVVLLALTSCGQKTLDHQRLVDRIHAWAVKQGAADSVQVDCPDDIKIDPGSTFHCLLRAGKQTARLTVTIENDQGYVTWQTG